MELIFVGIQGSGKGTQAKLLAEKYGYTIFETGGELRKIAQTDTDLGKKIKDIMGRGDLVSNDIIMELVSHFMDTIETGKKVIFDGIPRSDEQRVTLEELLAEKGKEFKAIEISISDEEAFIRLKSRAEIEGRADDTPEIIKKRIQNFYNFTQPLLEAWREKGRLVSINGEQSIEKVQSDILEGINLK